MVETFYQIPGAPHLALLADLHGSPYEDIIISLQKHRPQIICIPGDVVYGSQPKGNKSPLKTQKNILPFLRGCASVAPTFMSLGNHEWMMDARDIRKMKKTGVRILQNTYTSIDLYDGLNEQTSSSLDLNDGINERTSASLDLNDGINERTSTSLNLNDGTNDQTVNNHATTKHIVIGGLTSALVTDYRRFKENLDPSERAGHRYPRREKKDEAGGMKLRYNRVPDMTWLNDFTETPGFHILLSHHPEYIDLIPSGIELTLSGHAHGGQWRFWSPLTWKTEGLFAPGQGFFPKYTSGIHEIIYPGMKKENLPGIYKGYLIVSRGLTNTAPVPRINNDPEIVYVSG